jgi:hypothetical protein
VRGSELVRRQLVPWSRAQHGLWAAAKLLTSRKFGLVARIVSCNVVLLNL